MSLWAFRFLLWYICIMIVQPQNRFLFLYPLRIANLSILTAITLHVFSCLAEKRAIIRIGPATITALILVVMAFISQYTGPMQTSTEWNTYIDMLVKNVVMMVLLEAMLTSVERTWAVLGSMLFATLWWIKGGLRLAGAGMVMGGDRMFGPAVSLVVNPNLFAYMMCVFIPVYLYFYQQAKTRNLRLAFLGLALAAVYITLKTGSRTGFLLLIALGFILLPKYGRRHKAAFAVGLAASFFFFTIAGAMNLERFRTIPASIRSFFSGEVKEIGELTQDEQSAQERRLKNRDAWALIKKYPVFGAGINADETLMAQDYPYATGQVHCEILMAGRQMGGIGMTLYVALIAILFFCGWRTEATCQHSWPAISDIGWMLKMQCVVFIIGGIFSPIVWHPILLIHVTVASALWGHVRKMSVPVTAQFSENVMMEPEAVSV